MVLPLLVSKKNDILQKNNEQNQLTCCLRLKMQQIIFNK